MFMFLVYNCSQFNCPLGEYLRAEPWKYNCATNDGKEGYVGSNINRKCNREKCCTKHMKFLKKNNFVTFLVFRNGTSISNMFEK